MALPTSHRSSAAVSNEQAKRYVLGVPNGTADLGDLHRRPCGPAHRPTQPDPCDLRESAHLMLDGGRDHRAQVSAPTGSLGYTVLHGAGHIECKLAGSSKLQHTTDTPRDVHIYILCRQMCLNTPPDIYGRATGKARVAYKLFPLLASQRSR